MTNKQWLLWKMIDMSDEEFAKWVNVDCVYLIDGSYCARDCQHNCNDGRLKWLKQEHKECGEDGFYFKDPDCGLHGMWFDSDVGLRKILTGKAVIL